MPKHLTRIIDNFEVVPKAIVEVVAAYILYLMLETRGHQARQAARLSGKHESCFSRMLSRPDNLVIAKGCLNRSVRRRLERLKDSEKGARPMVLIDSTLVGRRGRNVENAGFYKLGKRTIRGHKIVNFVLVIGQDLIPLSAVAHYSREYCEENGFTYRTENELIIDWLNWLHYSGLFPKEYIKHLHFVCDAGYDARKVQKAFNRIGCHFTMCVKNCRLINDVSIDQYFRCHRTIPWQSIRLLVERNRKTKRKSYRVRFAAKVRLKGFGLVSAAYSETKRADGKKSRKYIVTSDLSLSAREVIEVYKTRWAIETWHKKMKQDHAYGDCRSPSFKAFESHINFCLAAYNLQRCHDPGIPKIGTTVAEYTSAQAIDHAAMELTRFDGTRRLKKQVREVLAEIINQEAA